MRNKISQVDENCSKVQEEVVNVKRKVQQFADNMIAVIEVKKHRKSLMKLKNKENSHFNDWKYKRVRLNNKLK